MSEEQEQVETAQDGGLDELAGDQSAVDEAPPENDGAPDDADANEDEE